MHILIINNNIILDTPLGYGGIYQAPDPMWGLIIYGSIVIIFGIWLWALIFKNSKRNGKDIN